MGGRFTSKSACLKSSMMLPTAFHTCKVEPFSPSWSLSHLILDRHSFLYPEAFWSGLPYGWALSAVLVSSLSGQVAAPNKAPKKEKTEKVEPSSFKGQAVQRLPTLLQDAATARTHSIKLADMQYAGELSKQLLDHAEKLEALYKDMQKNIANDADEKTFKALMIRARDRQIFGEKAEATPGMCVCVDSLMGLINICIQ